MLLDDQYSQTQSEKSSWDKQEPNRNNRDFIYTDQYLDDELDTCSNSAETCINDTYSKLYTDFEDQDLQQYSDTLTNPSTMQNTWAQYRTRMTPESGESSRKNSTTQQDLVEITPRRLSFSSMMDLEDLASQQKVPSMNKDYTRNDSPDIITQPIEDDTQTAKTSNTEVKSKTRTQKSTKSKSSKGVKTDVTGYHISTRDEFYVPIPFSEKSIKIKDFSTKSSANKRK